MNKGNTKRNWDTHRKNIRKESCSEKTKDSIDCLQGQRQGKMKSHGVLKIVTGTWHIRETV